MKGIEEFCDLVTETKDSAIQVMIDADAAVYKRSRDLPKLLAVWPAEILDRTDGGTVHVIERLCEVQRAMGQLAMLHHWSYDFSRHIAILAALKAERAYLAELRKEVRAA